jgi:hypothetical protein
MTARNQEGAAIDATLGGTAAQARRPTPAAGGIVGEKPRWAAPVFGTSPSVCGGSAGMIDAALVAALVARGVADARSVGGGAAWPQTP